MRAIVTAIFVGLILSVLGTDGWENSEKSRTIPVPTKVLWSAPFAAGSEAFAVEKTEGAEGEVEFRQDSVVVYKTNDKGRIIVSPRNRPTFPAGMELQSSIAMSTLAGVDPQAARGYIRLVGRKMTLTHFRGLDKGGMSQSPVLMEMVNGSPGMYQRKICRFIAEGNAVTPLLVVEGAASRSEWRGWTIEDHVAAKSAWRKTAVFGREPPDRASTMEDESKFDAALSADCEHTARVVTRGGSSALEVDGRIVPPVFYKPIPFGSGVPFTFEGRIFEEQAGIFLQTVNVRFGEGGGRVAFWSAGDRFDVSGAVRRVKDAMRAAPNSLFLVTLRLDAYPEYVEEHPDEAWLLAGGHPVYGNCSFGMSKPCDKAPDGMWKWVSTHSTVWQLDVKRHVAEFVKALKASGLDKRIIGVHFAGYHDGQFATMAPDFSPCALEGFKRYQAARFGRVKWDSVPEFDLEQDLFDPVKDAARFEYQRYLKHAAFVVQEEMAREFKRLIGKPVIAGRWCMIPFGCAMTGALDIEPFVKSNAIDFLVAQPGYELRAPGLCCPQTLPFASFAEHGKLYLGEFDTRTWHGRSGDDELKGMYLSEATDQAMWESLHRKLAGQHIALNQGWWYFDMTDNWFDDAGIQREIASVRRVHEHMVVAEQSGWRPTAAVVIDEEGLLRRNRIRTRANLEENACTAVQMRLLGRSGVPYDVWLMCDALERPERLTAYRSVMFFGAYNIDEKRIRLIRGLRERGVGLMFSYAAGCLAGAESLQRDDGIHVAEKPGAITPAQYHDFVARSGGYAPAPAGVMQIDMNGRFLSIHGLKSGHYDFVLPRKCRVLNLKSGRFERTEGGRLLLDLYGGESCWFEFQ